MPTDADHLARVRDPTIELLLSHTATLTDEWCSRPRPVDLAAITPHNDEQAAPSDEGAA